MKGLKIRVLLAISLLVCLGYYCSGPPDRAQTEQTYLNHHDSVRYVGKESCMQCHSGIHSTFMHTGMGQSFERASPKKSAANFTGSPVIYDKTLDLNYRPFFVGDSLFVEEFRLEGKDTVHKLVQSIQYIIGSGHHTNSHLFSSNGYVFQAPFTFYTQKGIWDLPPGFENGSNTRFTRQIGLECMSCHNAFPQFEKGSENRFIKVPNGIDCERCHGPGSIHVREKQAGNLVDTSKYIDYTIVNPGKLPVDLQFDLCQRCHLQGNAVLKPGKSFYDYKPGMKLSDVMEVFLPRYEKNESEFIMASHADRLKQSSCFKVMAEKHARNQELRPYKNALTCVTCHNPHVSVREKGPEAFNVTCKSCHSSAKHLICSEKAEARKPLQDNCIGCHMPVSGSSDIPHVTVHDHYIRKKPQKPLQGEARGAFKGLACINEPKAGNLSFAKAYIQQFEKFDIGNESLLDSAIQRIPAATGASRKENFRLLIHLYFSKKEYSKVIELTKEVGEDIIKNSLLNKMSWDNEDAWTLYRIGESYSALNTHSYALEYYRKAHQLAPGHFEFSNKFGSALLMNQQQSEAELVFRELCKKLPVYAPGWLNLGYTRLLAGDDVEAEACYRKAIQLNPDYLQAYVNLAGVLAYRGQIKEAQALIQKQLKKNPQNEELKTLMKRLQMNNVSRN